MFDEPLRTIQLSKYSFPGPIPEGSGAFVFKDTENRALSIAYKETGTHFNIEWLEKIDDEDHEKVDWLAARIYGIMKDAYETGHKEAMREVGEKLSGLKSLLK